MAFVGIARGAFLVNIPQAVYFLQSSEIKHTHLAVVKIRFEMLHFKLKESKVKKGELDFKVKLIYKKR